MGGSLWGERGDGLVWVGAVGRRCSRNEYFDFYSDFSKMELPFLSISWYIVHSDIILVMHPLKSGFYHILSPVYPGS